MRKLLERVTDQNTNTHLRLTHFEITILLSTVKFNNSIDSVEIKLVRIEVSSLLDHCWGYNVKKKIYKMQWQYFNAQGLCYNTTIFIFLDKMVRPVVKLNNRSTEMEIKALKLSSDMKESLRAPIIWERPSNAKMYDYHYEISGLYYQVT